MQHITCLIIITGSRRWRNRAAIRQGILDQLAEWGVTPEETGWLDGGAKGADTLGHEQATELGLYVAEPMTPDWPTCASDCRPSHRVTRWDGTEYCPTAGYRRNQAMTDRVAAFLARDPGRRTVCLVARNPGKSNGTDDCTERAKAAGIPIRWVG